MNQDTINSIGAYADLYNWDFRAIIGNYHYPLTRGRLNGIEARFEALIGIVEAIKADPDKEGIKDRMWKIAGVDWPGLLSLSGKEKEYWVRGMNTQAPLEEREKMVEDYKTLLGKMNGITIEIAGVLGLKYPIDKKEARAIFKREVVEGGKWGRILAALQAFKDSNPSKRDVALWAYYIWQSENRNKKVEEKVVYFNTFTTFHRAFAKMLGVEAGEYRLNYLGRYVAVNDQEYQKLTLPIVGKF